MKWWRGDVPSGSIGLALSAEEGFVLSRLESPLELREVLEQTGLPAERVEFILSLLLDEGLIVADTPSVRPAARTIPDVEMAPRPAIAPLLEAFAAYANERATPDARGAAAAWFRARVQRLVRLPSCPRLLLGHLARQPLVRRSPQLKRAVFLHPNLPPDARRKG